MSMLDEYDINARNLHGAGLLHYTMTSGCTTEDLATILARDDIDLNPISYDWGPPLCFAIRFDFDDFAMMFIDDDRTDLNASVPRYITALDIACETDKLEIAKHLLYRGATITDLIKTMHTPTAKFIIGHAVRWTPDTHKYHRRRVRERIEWWRAYCKRTKRVYKDIEFFICEILARASR